MPPEMLIKMLLSKAAGERIAYREGIDIKLGKVSSVNRDAEVLYLERDDDDTEPKKVAAKDVVGVFMDLSLRSVVDIASELTAAEEKIKSLEAKLKQVHAKMPARFAVSTSEPTPFLCEVYDDESGGYVSISKKPGGVKTVVDYSSIYYNLMPYVNMELKPAEKKLRIRGEQIKDLNREISQLIEEASLNEEEIQRLRDELDNSEEKDDQETIDGHRGEIKELRHTLREIHYSLHHGDMYSGDDNLPEEIAELREKAEKFDQLSSIAINWLRPPKNVMS